MPISLIASVPASKRASQEATMPTRCLQNTLATLVQKMQQLTDPGQPTDYAEAAEALGMLLDSQHPHTLITTELHDQSDDPETPQVSSDLDQYWHTKPIIL